MRFGFLDSLIAATIESMLGFVASTAVEFAYFEQLHSVRRLVDRLPVEYQDWKVERGDFRH